MKFITFCEYVHTGIRTTDPKDQFIRNFGITNPGVALGLCTKVRKRSKNKSPNVKENKYENVKVIIGTLNLLHKLIL